MGLLVVVVVAVANLAVTRVAVEAQEFVQGLGFWYFLGGQNGFAVVYPGHAGAARSLRFW